MKRLLFLYLAISSTLYSYSQLWDNSKPDQRITFGIRAGVNNSNLTESPYYNYHSGGTSALWSFHGGVNVDFNIVKSFAIETGLLYTHKGFRDGYYDENWNHEGLQIPILALYRLPLSEKTHLQIKGGGYLMYGGHEEFNSTDIGLILGTGISISKFYIGLQYEIGLNHVLDDASNRTLAISLGYDF